MSEELGAIRERLAQDYYIGIRANKDVAFLLAQVSTLQQENADRIPLDQFLATSKAALAYKARAETAESAVSTLQQERDQWMDSYNASQQFVITLRSDLAAARAALASTPGDPDAST